MTFAWLLVAVEQVDAGETLALAAGERAEASHSYQCAAEAFQ